MEEVLRLFNEIPTNYGTMLHALFREGRCEDGMKLFNDMQAHQLSPNLTTYNILLEALCKVHHIGEAFLCCIG